jgi:hypothetical protein
MRPRSMGRARTTPPSSAGISRTRLARLRTIALLVAGLAAPGAAHASYEWPVRPFDEPHPIRGGFCDPRMGDRHQLFHFGVDIAAPDRTPVYAVAPGVAWVDPAFPRTVEVVDGPSHMISYWHVVPAVPGGLPVGAHQLLGHVVRGAGHVHLTERLGGVPVNPLRAGALTPYRDRTAPLVQTVVAERRRTELDPSRLSGRIDLLAEVFDSPELPLPPPWTDNLLTPASVAWRLRTADGVLVRPLRTVFDCLNAKPADTLFWDVFGPGTSQNRPRAPGAYRFRLAHDFDTFEYPDGEYLVQVVASDVRGNIVVATFPITIQNLAEPTHTYRAPE